VPLQAWSKNIFRDRIDFEDTLTHGEVQSLIADNELKILQFTKPVNLLTWELLNNEFFTKRPEVELRAYGFYSLVCNLDFTSVMTNVHHFSADCLMNAEGVENIASMDKLESLKVGIYNLSGFEFLNQITHRLKKLFLGRTQSRKPSLSHLQGFDLLEEIYIEGQEKSIEVLSTLKNLKRVVLRSISPPELTFLRPLKRMWSLGIKLGGIRDLRAVEEMENIKYLELWQIKGLLDIDVVSSLTGLQYLYLQSLRNITRLPSFSRLGSLRRLSLENMRGLHEISSLEFAPALEEFIHWGAQNMQPEDYIPILRNPRLKRAAAGFASDKKSKRFNELLNEYHIGSDLKEFEFIQDAINTV
jgi:hypothetical protein